MNILVTGGAGYIGSHTCVALLDVFDCNRHVETSSFQKICIPCHLHKINNKYDAAAEEIPFQTNIIVLHATKYSFSKLMSSTDPVNKRRTILL